MAWILIIALSSNIYFVPSVQADLPGPYYIYGYIDNSTNQDIPSGVTVTVTNINRGTSGTTTTLSGGAFLINVGKDSGFNSSDNDQIVINCSYNGEVGENATNIDTNFTHRWCNLTGSTRLQPENLSINVTPGTWNAGSINYNNSSATSNTYFTLTNEGNVNISIKIHGENITWDGKTWYLNTTTGVNGFTVAYQKSGSGSWTKIGVTNASFITNLGYHSQYFPYTYQQQFGLNLSMPWFNSNKPSGSLSFNITLWSIKA
jgi:hypothetical protein